MEKKELVLELRNLSKSFGEVTANQCVSLSLYGGEILAVLGENGSGKTTLINMIEGIYCPDAGEIRIHSKPARIRTPEDAARFGIGVVHQHFMLVNRMDVVANVAICLKGRRKTRKTIRREILNIAEKYGFQIDPDKRIEDMSVSEKQTVEIIKVLMKGGDILILDEPTAVLTPQEAESLFAVLRTMKQNGKAILLITHKLREVLSISDEVYIMRKGRQVATVKTKNTTEHMLAEMMVGKRMTLSLECPKMKGKKKQIEVKNLVCRNQEGVPVIDGISFAMYSGEILGVAGIAGNGQKELCEALAGVSFAESGDIVYFNSEPISITRLDPMKRDKLGVRIGFVPEDRLGMGLIASADMTDNILLQYYRAGKSVFVNRKEAHRKAEELIEQLEIATPGASTPVRLLSGGNIQKVLLGREMKRNPKVLIVAYPTRGLDVHSSYAVYRLLNQEKQNGTAILFVGEDLDVLMGISDRIMVLSDHAISGIVKPKDTTKEKVGYLCVKAGEAGA